MLIVRTRLLFLIGLSGLLSACSMYQYNVQNARNSLRGGQFAAAAENLKPRAFQDSDDQLIYLLDYALAEQYAGRFDESNQALQLADQISEVKDYHSISRITGSLLLSESLVQYKGEDFEKVLINAFGAINYLMLGNLESALIEARRLNEKLQFYKDEAKRNYEQNVFARYISAIAWEAQGQYDDAYIDYEESYRLNPSIPSLKADLIRSAIQAQRPEKLKKWQAEFAGTRLDPNWNNPDYGELVLIYQQGWGPVKRPHPAWFRIPKLYPVPAQTQQAQLIIDGQLKALSDEIYSVQEVAIKTLDDQYAGLIAKRIAAKVVQNKVAGEIRKKNQLLGDLSALAMKIADQADLRQWSMLPASLQVIRVYLPKGTYSISARGLSSAGAPTGERMPEKTVEIGAGQKTFLNWRSLR